MCWRDDVPMMRVCSLCGEGYYGDLGHRGCPGPRVKMAPPPPPEPELCSGCKDQSEPHDCKVWVQKPLKGQRGKMCECPCAPPF
jgi:hypothetical protein